MLLTSVHGDSRGVLPEEHDPTVSVREKAVLFIVLSILSFPVWSYLTHDTRGGAAFVLIDGLLVVFGAAPAAVVITGIGLLLLFLTLIHS